MTAAAMRPSSGLPVVYGDLHRWALVHADALALLRQFPPHSVDAVVTDPPYGLAFNGEPWDGGKLADGHGFEEFTRWWAGEIRRVLKPGGYLAAFGAPRTVHRLVAGCEAGGLEVRDQLLWCFATGVPKSRRMKDGLGSALKPAYEPILLARTPLDTATPTILGNVERYGTGALNIGATRIAKSGGEAPGEGYWPATLALEHQSDCDEAAGHCVPGCVVPMIDRIAAQQSPPGSPPFSRLFFAAKASRSEREAGLEHLPATHSPIFSASGGRARVNLHPTVKPIGLMRWIVRLVVPPGGVTLDPFTGSGSTGIAAVLEGRQFVGIEREMEYVDIARARLAHWAAVARSGGSS